MLKIKRNDDVLVTVGRDKGKRGKVLKVLDNGRLIVSGINMVKKHTKPNPQQGIAGGIVQKEAPIDSSNLGIFNPKTEKADRVGFRVLDDGKKVRFFKSDNELIDV